MTSRILAQPPGERDGLVRGGGLAGVARLGQLGHQGTELGTRLHAELGRQPVAAHGRAGRSARSPLERRGHQLAPELEVDLDGPVRVLAARREPVGARQHRDLDLYRLAAAQVAIHRGLVERALVHEEAQHEVVARDRAEELAQLLARPQPAAYARDHLLAHGVVADERDAAVRQHLARGRLRDVVGERAEAKRLGTRELVRERLVEQSLYARTELRAEYRGRTALDPQLLAQHLERVTVHVEVVEVALLYAVEGGELGQHGGDEAEAVGKGEPFERALGDHESAELGEDALRRGLGHGVRRLERQAFGVRIWREAELGGEPGEAQGTQRVGLVRAGQDAQHLPPYVLDPVVRIDGLAARERHGDRVCGEVALSEVLLDRAALEQRDVAREAVVARHDAPGAELLGEAEGRCLEAFRDLLGGGPRIALHGDVEVGERPVEQGVAHRAADDPGRYSRERLAGSARARLRLQLFEAHYSCR